MTWMENTVVLACATIRDELDLIHWELACPYPIVWVTENRHDAPDRLRQILQRHLNELAGYERVLMSFGICGQATLGLQTRDFQLILPRIDDCISLLLGSSWYKAACQRGTPALFLTTGWLDSQWGIEHELARLDKKYGGTKAAKLQQQIYGEFSCLCLIDTGSYSLEVIQERSAAISSRLHLEQKTVQGDLGLLRKLLTGPWDHSFIQVGAHSELTAAKFQQDCSVINYKLMG